MADETHTAPEARPEGTLASRYELIIVAAREARRLNEYYRQRAIQPKRRVTSEAIDRVFQGPGVPYEFVSASQRAAEEAAAEAPPEADAEA